RAVPGGEHPRRADEGRPGAAHPVAPHSEGGAGRRRSDLPALPGEETERAFHQRTGPGGGTGTVPGRGEGDGETARAAGQVARVAGRCGGAGCGRTRRGAGGRARAGQAGWGYGSGRAGRGGWQGEAKPCGGEREEGARTPGPATGGARADEGPGVAGG